MTEDTKQKSHSDDPLQTESTVNTSDEAKQTDSQAQNANRDALTGEPGSHPLGVGFGTVIAGAAAGTAAGAVAGPVGSMVGTIVGGVAGALAGKELAEQFNPTELSACWESIYQSAEYFEESVSYLDYDAAYRYGYEARQRFQNRPWEEIELDLAAQWPNYSKGRSQLDWTRACRAAHDGYIRDYAKGCGGDC